MFTTAATMCCCLSLHAATHLSIELKSGEKYAFLLADNPILTFQKGNLVVNGDATTSYSIGDVKMYHFTEEPLSANQTTASDEFRIVAIDDATLQLQNMPALAEVTLVGSNGVLLKKKQTNKAGDCVLELPAKKGVYVITAGNKSFKLIRK